jgi:hypothetical protein
MEIQKIFSEIDTDEKLYSVLLSEDELALFSEISDEFEQREFNSKAQKALRKIYDSTVGKNVTKSNTLYNRSIGREASRKLGGTGVNASINEKALVNGSGSIKARIPERGARSVGKKFLANTEVGRSIYDRDHIYKPTSEVIKSAKDIMKRNM